MGCAFEIVFLPFRLIESVGKKVFRKPFSLKASRCYQDDPNAQAKGVIQLEWQKVRVQDQPWRHGPETPAIHLEHTVAWDYLSSPKAMDLQTCWGVFVYEVTRRRNP